MATYTTEITSDKIASDNPIHQRLLKAYILAKDHVSGDLLELGCGEGRGIEELQSLVSSYTAVDKIREVIERLGKEYAEVKFIQANIPPLADLKDNSYDFVVSFQVIEHIKKDRLFLEEIYRVLKPGGKCIITTPNRKMSLTRNPWHIREYSAKELLDLTQSIFDEVEALSITGNSKVMEYYEANKESVRAFTKYDILNLQYRLPRWMLKIPYDLANRMNRNNLMSDNDSLVNTIHHEDYTLSKDPDQGLDHFYILSKS